MAENLTESEKAQLTQTIEMFEVITQSSPEDYQSMEILKEAYVKLGMDDKVLETSKSMARAYHKLGQFTSAVMEVETILQNNPNDTEAQQLLEELEKGFDALPEPEPEPTSSGGGASVGSDAAVTETDDGKEALKNIFVAGSILTEPDFESSWPTPDSYPPGQVVPPLVQVLSDRGLLEVDEALKHIALKSGRPYIEVGNYDVDVEQARTFDKEVCKRWCVLPIDRMSKIIIVATANPFNKLAAAEIERTTKNRIVWYLAPPEQLVKVIGAVFH